MSAFSNLAEEFRWHAKDEVQPAEIYSLFDDEPARATARPRLLVLVVCGLTIAAALAAAFVWLQDKPMVPAGVVTPYHEEADAAPATPGTASAEVTDEAAIVIEEPRPAPVASPAAHLVHWPESLERRFAALSASFPVAVEPKPVKPVVQEKEKVAAPAPAITLTRVPGDVVESRVLDKVRMQLFSGDRRGAKQTLADLLGEQADAHEARRVLAGLLIQDGQWRDVAILLAGVDTAAPFALREMKARVLLRGARVDEAIALLEHNPPKLGDAESYHALLAALYQRAGRFSDSVLAYRRLADLAPHNANYLLGYAVGLEHTDISAALDAYKAALESDGLTAQLSAFVTSKIRTLSYR
ncbi:MAG: hypothetical protein KDI19_03000 [Pseudomonadales bacterium]|nr:hypothetical protein [Pseudomonadales bacterium]